MGVVYSGVLIYLAAFRQETRGALLHGFRACLRILPSSLAQNIIECVRPTVVGSWRGFQPGLRSK